MEHRGVVEAPTFDVARGNLYAQVCDFTFGKVVRDCKVPEDAREPHSENGKSVVTHYHGIAQSIRFADDDPALGRIWFKKGTASYNAFILGPVEIKLPDEFHIPAAGDILMGKTVENKQQATGRVGLRYGRWYPSMNALCSLFRMVRCGTSKTEAQLSHELRLPNGEHRDQLWAIARLILFGNVQVFADIFHGTANQPMAVGDDVVLFISECSYHFEDATIWERFYDLAPSAQRPPRPVRDHHRQTHFSHSREQPVVVHHGGPVVKPLAVSRLHAPPQQVQSHQPYEWNGGGNYGHGQQPQQTRVDDKFCNFYQNQHVATHPLPPPLSLPLSQYRFPQVGLGEAYDPMHPQYNTGDDVAAYDLPTRRNGDFVPCSPCYSPTGSAYTPPGSPYAPYSPHGSPSYAPQTPPMSPPPSSPCTPTEGSEEGEIMVVTGAPRMSTRKRKQI